MNIRQSSWPKSQHVSAMWLEQISNLTQNTIQIDKIKKQASQRLSQICTLITMTEKQLSQWLQNAELIQLNKQSIKSMINNGLISLAKNQHKIYFGGVENKKKKGIGILIQKSKSYFEGQFQDNDRQGRGVEIYANGNVYLGNFEKNKKHGSGQFFWFNISVGADYYELYDGEWWGGLPDGKGLHQKNNGDIYLGEFKNGLKHGTGKQQTHNMDQYYGQFLNGAREGKGTYTWKNGASYQGQFKQGYKDGKGFWKSPLTNEKYQGQYRKDKKNGFGTYVWGQKFTYKGYFKNDKRHGFGEFFERGQLKYRGMWVDDEKQNNNEFNFHEFKNSRSRIQVFTKKNYRQNSSIEPKKLLNQTMAQFPNIIGEIRKSKSSFKRRIMSEPGESNRQKKSKTKSIKDVQKLKIKGNKKGKSFSQKKQFRIKTLNHNIQLQAYERLRRTLCGHNRCKKINCGCNDAIKPEQPFLCNLDNEPSPSVSRLNSYLHKI